MRLPVARLQPLPRAVRVDADLHRGLEVRHPAQLVVHDAQTAVVEHVDAIGLAADLDVALQQAVLDRKSERPEEFLLEQTLAHA